VSLLFEAVNVAVVFELLLTLAPIRGSQGGTTLSSSGSNPLEAFAGKKKPLV
jgi:hypothetical protein